MALAQVVDSGLSQAGWRRRAFLSALAFVTALPVLGLGFALGALHRDTEPPQTIAALLAPIIAVTGVAHVASTSYMYLDRDLWSVIRLNKARFFAWPLLCVAVACAATYASHLSAAIFSTAFIGWQLWHFQRQNFGVLSFSAAAGRVGPVPASAGHMLNLSAVAGICATLASATVKGTVPLPGSHILRLFAGVLFIASTALLLRIMIREKRLTSDPMTLLFVLLGWAFFIPAILWRNPVLSFTSFAIAHGAQYLIFMTVLAEGRSRWFGAPVLAAVTLMAYFLAAVLVVKVPMGLPIYLGLVMGHFLIDAKFWKMREPEQRRIIRDRFGFLFD